MNFRNQLIQSLNLIISEKSESQMLNIHKIGDFADLN